MLARESHDITVLILARQILLAKAAETNAAYEYLTTLHSAPFDRLRPSTSSQAEIDEKFAQVVGNLQLSSALLADLDERIAAAWQRLDEVRPTG